MTTQDQIITICILAFIGIPLGTFTAIKTINKLSRPPVNALNRTGDIELVDYIEPTRPQQIFNYPDLLESTHERFSNHVGYGRVPSMPPSYHTVDRWYIHSSLENNINLDFAWVIFFFISILIISLLIRKYRKEKLLLILIWILKFGFFVNSVYAMSILIPFSFYEIDFRDSFDWKFNSYGVKPKISYHNLQTLTNDIELLLLSLTNDVNYSMSLSFISSYNVWKDNKEKIDPLFINDAIIVNKESDPVLITQFIMQSLNEKGLFITNWLFKDDIINKIDPVILTVTVAIKVEI
jgi:hypothetical protein